MRDARGEMAKPARIFRGGASCATRIDPCPLFAPEHMFPTMAARALGTSAIVFGLVSLPVKIYSTGGSSRKVSFNMIWKERSVRVRQQYIDP